MAGCSTINKNTMSYAMKKRSEQSYWTLIYFKFRMYHPSYFRKHWRSRCLKSLTPFLYIHLEHTKTNSNCRADFTYIPADMLMFLVKRRTLMIFSKRTFCELALQIKQIWMHHNINEINSTVEWNHSPLTAHYHDCKHLNKVTTLLI